MNEKHGLKGIRSGSGSAGGSGLGWLVGGGSAVVK